MIRYALMGFLTAALYVELLLEAQADDKPVGYQATEDVVYGHKDGLALTLDVIEPQSDRNGLGHNGLGHNGLGHNGLGHNGLGHNGLGHNGLGRNGRGLILVSSGSWSSKKSDILAEEENRRQNDHWVQGLIKGGFTVFIVRHGSSPRYHVPDMTPDIIRSVRFVRANAERFKVDPENIGITSGSSGGHLSLMAAMKGDDGIADSKDPIERVSSRTQAVVAWFPPTDLINWSIPKGYAMIELTRPGFFEKVLGKVTDLEPQLREISPLYFASNEAPPLLLIHGDADKTVPLQQSEIMKKKYEELGLTVKLIVHPGGGHSSWPGVMDQYPAVWDWFNEHLK